MFFEKAVLHLFKKFLETHLWQCTFQQSCYLTPATTLKKITLSWKFFKEFTESVKYSCCKKHHWRRKISTSKSKQNNSKGADSLCLNYTHGCISCKSMKNKSWYPRMVTRTHENILAVSTTRLLWCVCDYVCSVQHIFQPKILDACPGIS